MKRRITLGLIALTFSVGAMAQDYGTDSTECAKNVSVYDGHMKNKMYANAVEAWRNVIAICPKFGESIYINGAIIFEDFIKNETDEARKAELVDTLLNVIWKNRCEFFPTPDAWGRYGTASLKYNQADPAFALSCFEKAFEGGEDQVSMGAVLGYYQAVYLMYATCVKNGCEEKDELKVRLIDDFIRLSSICTRRAGESDNWKVVAENLLKYFNGAIKDCDALITVATEAHEADPDNCETTSNMLKILDMQKCTDSEIYATMAVKYYESCEQSPEAAYNLGTLYFGKGEYSKAAGYYSEAYDGATEDADKCKFALAAASAYLKSGSYKTAAGHARNAVSCEAGSAYYIIGQCVAKTSSSCGDNEFEQKAVYWLAMDYMEKAKANGNGSASSAYDSYSTAAPGTSLKFDYGYTGREGESYTIECWGESTTVR